MWCLVKQYADSFIAGLKSGEIDPAHLSTLTSDERRAYLAKFVGEADAKHVNALFESKLLLKNQKYGMVTWAKEVAGLKPALRRDLISRIERLDHVLDPAEEGQFLKDLASTKLGIDVTQEEAKGIADLSKQVTETREATRSSIEDAHKPGFTPSKADLAYGHARYDLQKHISDLTKESQRLKVADLKGRGALGGALRLPRYVADVSKSIGASLDDSFALRQGFKAFFTDNRAWQREFKQSFLNIAKGARDGEAAHREFNARLMADPLYDQAVGDGLAIHNNDDIFPTLAPGKIPVLGRAFTASEVAYSAFADNLRLAIYKKQLGLADQLGEKMGGDFGKNIAKEVNSLTGRGGFGQYEPVANHLNIAFYSLRFLKSNVDTLFLHPLGIGVGGIGSKAQLKAATNLVKIIAGTAAVLETANALMPGSVDFDPRSSDFGMIKVGDTRFNVSGGMGSIVTLAARLATMSSKSSTTGKITKLNSGKYGSPTGMDVATQFLENKASPVGGVIVDLLKGLDHSGNKPTLSSEALRLVTPLNVSNYFELKNDPHSANILTAILADTFGISTNTYSPAKSSTWLNSTAKGITEFRAKVGEQTFKEASKKYDQRLQAWTSATVAKPDYQGLSDAEKQAVLDKGKELIQKNVFKEYNFTPSKTKQSQGTKQTERALLKVSAKLRPWVGPSGGPLGNGDLKPAPSLPDQPIPGKVPDLPPVLTPNAKPSSAKPVVLPNPRVGRRAPVSTST